MLRDYHLPNRSLDALDLICFWGIPLRLSPMRFEAPVYSGGTMSSADISLADIVLLLSEFVIRLEVVASDSPADCVLCLLLMEKQGGG